MQLRRTLGATRARAS